MEQEKQFAVFEVSKLEWPTAFDVRFRRFRLLVAADVSSTNAQAISDFALAAFERGMVYFCAWGPGCEKFHDIVDEVRTADDLSDQEFAGPNYDDVVMTTSHADETLEEALDFLATGAFPTDGLAPGSDLRVVICVGNSDWTATANQFLKSAGFFD